MCQSENSGEIEIMGKNQIIILSCPVEDFCIRGSRVSDLRPMHRNVPSPVQPVDPNRRQVNIEKYPHLAATNGDLTLLNSPGGVAQGGGNILSLQVWIGAEDLFLGMAEARRPNTVPTVIRSPRIQGLPPMTFGSSVTRPSLASRAQKRGTAAAAPQVRAFE